MSDETHPGIVQHGHMLANGCSLVERIDNGRPEGFDAPPQRRYRLVLDLGADDLDTLGRRIDEIADSVVGRRCTGGTSGSPDSGYHYELIEDKTSWPETYFDRLMAWRDRRGATTAGATSKESNHE